MTESTKKIRKTTIIIQTIFCSLTVILTALYALDIQSGINLTTVNMLCFSFYFTQLAPGLIECNNHQKAQWLFAAVFISASVTSLNLWIDYRTLSEFHLSAMSGWCFTWIILLLIASISTIYILIRLFRWSQEQWEEIRKIRQQHRKKTKESWIDYFNSRNTHRLEMQDLAQKQRKELRENKQKNRTVIKIQVKRVVLALLLCALIGVFFLLPFLNITENTVSTWFDSVKNFNKFIFDKDFKNISEALLYYILFYIAIVSLIIVLCFLIYRIVDGKKDKKEQTIIDLTEQYSAPVAILIVFGSFLFVLTNGDYHTEWVNQEWIVLFLIILVMLVLLTAIEIVRLVITQCVEPHSLLKQLIYLVFVAVLRFLSEILLGVIVNFRIQTTISSLLIFLFPESDGSISSFNNRLNTQIDRLFNNAISGQTNIPQNASKTFQRKRIWRRYKK